MKRQDNITFIEQRLQAWVNDWCLFAGEAMEVTLDEEQKAILRSVQYNKMTSVCSGTARGKDFISAVAAICFLYLIPNIKSGKPESTKVAMTAPTDRQVKDIMMPEISNIYSRLKANGIMPYGARLNAYDIRTDHKDYFLTGFKADEHRHEAWSGFHAVNTFFIVTEASGISENVFNAIEGNLQNNSRLLIVFNNNTGSGYAAQSQKSKRFHHFRLDSLNAPNVKEKRVVIPGQVDHEWVADKVRNWCYKIDPAEYLETEGDFSFDLDGVTAYYRPNDLFRVKVRGMAPKVAEDALVPAEWVEAANNRWKAFHAPGGQPSKQLRLGTDVAGMGRDSSCFCFRYDNYVKGFKSVQSGGKANHMEIAGMVKTMLQDNSSRVKGTTAQAFIDTIGEGAGVFSRLEEQKTPDVYSVKFSSAAEYRGRVLKDITGQYEFLNLRAYLYWCIRDWLNPVNNTGAMLPPDDDLLQELTETRWEFMSNGKIKIEPKEEIKKRLKRSPDKSDALANTFYPVPSPEELEAHKKRMRNIFSALP